VYSTDKIRVDKLTPKKLETSYIEGRKQFKGLKRSNKAKMEFGKVYYCLEDLDERGVSLDWYEDDVIEFDKLYHEGKSVQWLSEYFGRGTDEVAILILDRAIKDKINPEKRGR
jgi:hypothetical protein